MFEKERVKYQLEHTTPSLYKVVGTAWKDGAEFGYKKANEWHKVADGDLPPKTTLVLIKACGCFILGWVDDNDVWHNDSDNGARIPKENVYAWKEIVLPKEIE